MSRITIRDAAPAEGEQALQLALAEPGMQAQRTCEMTRAYLRRCGGSVGGLHVAESAGRAFVACAGLDLPGRVSLLMVPSSCFGRCAADVLGRLLARAAQAAADRDQRFAQILLDPEIADQARSAVLQADFIYLASLQYMARGAFDPARIQPVPQVEWATLAEVSGDLFAATIQRTYLDSRDCPALTGVRSMEEVLASHRCAGEFDPAGWYLLRHAGHNAGVILTARSPQRTALEIVYTGLVPEARGRGLGRLCVHKAILRARDLAIPSVSLAVDSGNEPALRLYAGLGFAAYSTREVWIRVFRRADAEGLFEWPDR